MPIPEVASNLAFTRWALWSCGGGVTLLHSYWKADRLIDPPLTDSLRVSTADRNLVITRNTNTQCGICNVVSPPPRIYDVLALGLSGLKIPKMPG